jgi:hypothetical protein
MGEKIVECNTCQAIGRRMTTQEVMAIETREYHVKCQDCRYGKWTGQDVTYARLLRSEHRQDHHVVMDYAVPEPVKRQWRILYGTQRRPKMIISREDQ